MRDLNFVGHGIYATCPISCTTGNSYSLYLWDIRGGLTEDQGDNFWGLLDPGTNAEGSTYGIASLTVADMDGDNNPLIGPCFAILNVPGKYSATVSGLHLDNAFCGAATGSISMTGAPDLQPPNISTFFEGTNCADGLNGTWASLAQQGGLGLVRARNAGSCIGALGAGIQTGLGVYQVGTPPGGPVHNFNFVTLIPPPSFLRAPQPPVRSPARFTIAPPQWTARAGNRSLVLRYPRRLLAGYCAQLCDWRRRALRRVRREYLRCWRQLRRRPRASPHLPIPDHSPLTSRMLPANSQAFESMAVGIGRRLLRAVCRAIQQPLSKAPGLRHRLTDPGPSSNIKWAFYTGARNFSPA